MTFDWPITLEGEHLILRPLVADDAVALFAATPQVTFQYFLSWPRQWNAEAFAIWMNDHINNTKTRAMAVIDRASGVLVGSSSFMDIDPVNRCVEIGCTWYDPSHRGTRTNPECKLLMLGHAFEALGCVRVTLKCDARNLHSQRAIAGIGAAREGTLRKHRIQPNGFVRDTVYFSVIAEEWPIVKHRLLARLRDHRG